MPDMMEVKKTKNMYSSEMEYPNGTKLRMDKDMMMGMGMEGLMPGDKVMVKGYATVCAVTMYDESMADEYMESSTELQLTDMSVQRMENPGEKSKRQMGDMYPS